ncbi:DUF2147 domain-containing protein [Aquicoccus sp. SCR17]|nr:DUF2147 domain-containing protein [Carideicomes alvinocaridis]
MDLRLSRAGLAALAAICLGSAVEASEPILGTWASPPDNKDQTGHIVVSQCGQAYCGTLVRAYSPQGDPITTKNVGKRLFWDMRAEGGGLYDDGKVYVPLFGRTYDAEIRVSGNRLKVRGCLGPVCKDQTWARVD